MYRLSYRMFTEKFTINMVNKNNVCPPRCKQFFSLCDICVFDIKVIKPSAGLLGKIVELI